MIPATHVVPLLAFSLRSGIVVAPVGKSVPLETRYGVPLASVLIADTSVTRMVIGPDKDVRLEGNNPGTTWVALTGPKDKQWRVLVVVPR